MDIVTFETAIKLKKAGFPQPEPEAGQVWYLMESKQVVTSVHNYMDGHCKVLVWSDHHIMAWPTQSLIFAPTAPDLLPKLEHPDPTVDFFLFWSDDLFSVIRAYWMDASGNIGEHANPAEACAAAWLELKKGKL